MPRERLMQYGPEACSVSELLAILLRTGTKECSVVPLAQRLLNQFDGSLISLQQQPLSGLKVLKGIGEVKAITIQSALELGVRYYRERMASKTTIQHPEDVYALCFEMCFEEQETVRVISLDSKSHVVGYDDITKGTVNASLIHPREVYRKAILHSAVSIILVHNHPSGDPSPSIEDQRITEKIIQCGELLSISCRDHVIIGKGSFYSFTVGKTFMKGEMEDGRESGNHKIAEVERSN